MRSDMDSQKEREITTAFDALADAIDSPMAQRMRAEGATPYEFAGLLINGLRKRGFRIGPVGNDDEVTPAFSGREREAYDAGRLAGYEDGMTDTENRIAAEMYAAAERAAENKGNDFALVAAVWRSAAALVYGPPKAEP